MMAEQKSGTRRAAFVTGASQGIGAATAVAFAQNGFDVAVSSTQPDKLAKVLDEIKAAGTRSLAVPLDLRSQASIEQAMAAVAQAFGHVDVLVNNAGIPLTRPALEVSREEWGNVMQTNLDGTFFMSQQMARHLVAAKRPGCVINMTSTHGVVGFMNVSAYAISKGAIIHMTKVLAYEWAQHGIRVNAIAPGKVDTPSREGYYANPKHIEFMLNRVPLHRFAAAEEIAQAVCYLASPQASYITGQTLVMDGGVTIY